MSTAFTLLVPFSVVDGDVRLVTLAKNPISFFSCGHGNPPPFPMPRLGVAARMSVSDGGFGVMVDVDSSLP
jgi:hypothetical protein